MDIFWITISKLILWVVILIRLKLTQRDEVPTKPCLAINKPIYDKRNVLSDYLKDRFKMKVVIILDFTMSKVRIKKVGFL